MLVAGQILVRDYQVLTMDEATIRAEAQAHAEAIDQRMQADPVHQEMVLLDAMAQGQL